ncbi:hypothetical protein M501DRAFT_934638 [Patellaria atrata CBS 101060]|uniref:Methyltransferase n=1 Tax=Patellaria atrata CBS 101060 TaxID=1346257 RepID=A0A9P4S9S6_9PEZI|nr:hypothetical protein M501DRAFT_934638 [Patellaria atrata CBS 101060]
MTDTITASIRYVRRDQRTDPNEKGYILHYAAPAGFPQNNFTIKSYPNVKVHNLRTSAHVRWESHGITLASLDSSQMKPEYFDDDDWIERVYLPELHDCLCKVLGAQDVTIFDWMLRKRAISFPVRKEGEEEAAQPSLSAHIEVIDYTTAELDGRLDQYFGAEKEKVMGRRYQVINIWKPLTGPCRDYPMAYCDPTSVNREKDLFLVDEVFPTVANEVFQVYHNPNHIWYYVPDQLDSEVSIFNAYDSEKGQELAVPHCSFNLGEAGSGIPRQSIEVRAFIFY